MTFNLRFENDRDGVNGWLFRRELVIEVVRHFAPAILGTQEGTPAQLYFLQERMPEYRMLCASRPDDATCQYPTLFYRHDALFMKMAGEFWLSKTPDVHRSKDWDSAFPRMMGYGLFVDPQNRKEFWAAVTHLDNIGAEARLEQTKIIAEWMRGRSGPHILMGDFNDRPGSPVHRFLTSTGLGLRDTWEMLMKTEDEQSMTHHGFLGTPQMYRMDWILISPGFAARDATIIRDHREGLYPSDHFPYGVELDWS